MQNKIANKEAKHEKCNVSKKEPFFRKNVWIQKSTQTQSNQTQSAKNKYSSILI